MDAVRAGDYDALAKHLAVATYFDPPTETEVAPAVSGKSSSSKPPQATGPRKTIMEALWTGDYFALVEHLKEGRERIEWGHTWGGFLPLHYAAHFGWLAIAQLLMDAGAEVDRVDARGWTPLIVAIVYGQASSAELLLEAGADFNLGDAAGTTPLRFAALYGNLEIVKLLCAFGATRTGEEEEDATDSGFPEVAAFFSNAASSKAPCRTATKLPRTRGSPSRGKQRA